MSIQEVANLAFAFAIARIVVKLLGWVVLKLGKFILQQRSEMREPQLAIPAPGTNGEERTGMNNRKQAVQHDERLP